MSTIVGKLGWKIVTTAIGVPIGVGVSKGIAKGWLAARPHNPPRKPTDPNVSWGDAAGWAALSAVGVAVGQVVTTKGATTVWRALTGFEPPPVQKQIKTQAKAEAKAEKRAVKELEKQS